MEKPSVLSRNKMADQSGLKISEQFSVSSGSISQPKRKKRKFSNGITDDAYWEKIKKKGKTNVTVQKMCLQLRADTLYQQHHYDVVVLFHSCVPGRERDRHIIDFYATPGNARLFMAGADQKKSDAYEATIYRAFSQYFKEQPSVTSVRNGSSVHPSVPQNQTSSLASSSVPQIQTTTLASSSVPQSQTTTRASSSVPLSQTTTRASSSVPQSQTTTCASSSVPQIKTTTRDSSSVPQTQAFWRASSLVPEATISATSAGAEMLVYKVNNVVVAGGYGPLLRPVLYSWSPDSSRACLCSIDFCQRGA